jgi:NADP-dependent 3-hydroxy acid dehydrogenase YdfG
MKNKTIVITGVSGGVGRSLAKIFIKKGWTVLGLGRTKRKLELLKDEISHNNFAAIEVDIRDPDQVAAVFQYINQKIDVLVNNASVFISRPFSKCSVKDINDILDTNLKGTMFCTMEALKKMGKGRIINIGSVSGTHGIENQAIYSASKYGLVGFSESIGQEHEEILFTTICPGGINTPLWNESNPYPGDISKTLSPDDIASVVEYVADLPENVVLKTMTIFPNYEWH